MKRMLTFTALFAIAGLLLLVGCATDNPDNPAAAESNAGPSPEGEKYMLASQPEGAKDVIPAREAATDGEDVVVVGRIGGDVDPWIDGRAAFSIVDNSLKACSDIEGDQCPTPWDYCCEPDLPSGMVLVKVVDDQGETVKSDARQLLGVKELSTVVVQGKAQRDDAGNLTVLANKIYVK